MARSGGGRRDRRAPQAEAELAHPPHYNRRQRNPTLELVVTVVVMALLVVTVLVFLFVYHDFPFRLGGP